MLKAKINQQNKLHRNSEILSTHINSQTNPNKNNSNGLFTTEFDINNVRISTRNILTKGQTHDEIALYSGASITTRGRFISPAEKSRGFVNSRSLYLFIQGNTQQSVALAVQKINEIISNDQQPSGNSHNTGNRMTKFNNRPPLIMTPQQNANQQQPSTFVEKMMIGLEHAPSAFNLREQVIGAGGANLHYIRNETGAIATLRGRGSLFIDPILHAESVEPLHLYIEHPRYDGLQAAKQLAKNLIETLQQEVVHFQQINQNTSNVSFSNAGTIIQQGQPVTQINVPPPILAVPPPIVQQQPQAIETQANQATLVQPNFIQQNPPPSLGGPPQTVQSQPQTIIHQQIIPQSMPIQLQQGNMVIQQPVQQPPTIGNVNIPPPGIPIPIKTGQIVQFQGPPPPPPTAAHLTQPPPNVQLQPQQQQATAQIVLNHPQNYQYQYIQQPVQPADSQMQANQVTIQHIYQPQQQIQGIVQQAPPNSQAQAFDQFQQVRPMQTAPQQQYITVQGSTAYMVPPPTIIHQATSQPQQQQQVQTQITTSNPNIIFQPPPQIQQVQMQVTQGIPVQNVPPPPPPPPTTTAASSIQEQTGQSSGSGSDETANSEQSVKDELKTDHEDNNNPSQKSPDIKTEGDTQSSDSNSDSSSQPQTSSTTTTVTVSAATSMPQQQSISIRHPPPPPAQHLATSLTLPATQVPPPIMAVPPPMSCVQHIVGNTLITTHPTAQTHTNQIYNQVPVSIHQIQPTGQQIHVSTPTGQHFVVNTAPQWQSGPPPTAQISQQQPIQQIQSNGTIQNVQITHHQIGDFRGIPPPGAVAPATATPQHQPPLMTFNPQVQVQFQPQMLQQMPPSQTIESAQIISSQISHPSQHFSVVQSQQTQQIGVQQGYQQTQPLMSHFPQQMKQTPFSDQFRSSQKRKHDEDDNGPHQHPTRMGMGPRDHIQHHLAYQQQQQLQQPPPPPPPLPNTSNHGNNSIGQGNGGSNNNNNNNGPSSANSSSNNAQDENNGQKSQQDTQHSSSHGGGGQQQQQQQSHGPPPSFFQDNRPFYQRDMGNDSYMDGPPRPPFDGPPGGGMGPIMPPRGPRFHQNNGGMGGPGYPMRPPLHMQDGSGMGNFPIHRMNLGPPPPPPPPPYRGGDCPPNMNGGYGPPPPRFRGGQW